MNARLITRWLALCAAAIALLAPPALAQPSPPLGPPDVQDGKTFRVLAFHDVRTQVRASFATDPDESAVDETTLAGLFGWLQASGWQPVSLEQIVRARAGGVPLPRQAVLLTFDDGYASAYTKVFPLLRQFNYPAVMALVTRWMEVPAGGQVPYGNKPLARERFLTWAQTREMARSGLVEFASHSHDLHRGLPGNPQGNLLPAATTHAWDATRQRYEDGAAWTRRIEADLRQSRALIERHTGRPVRALAWPYGAWNQGAQQAAQRAGFSVAFTLEDGPNHAGVPLMRLRRAYATYDIDPPGYLPVLRQSPDQPSTRGLQRAMHVDLDYVYDADPAQQERNLSLLLDRVRAVGPRSVFLQAYADPDGDGVADALYFPNRVLPMRADLFNRVAWQLRTRARVQVYAWMPVLAFRLPAGHPLAARTVAALATTPAAQAAAAARYHRLSPFDPAVRELIGGIYDDLGRHASFAGVLFHDDAMLSDDEDTSPAALAAYRDAGLPVAVAGDIAALRADDSLRSRWQALKAHTLTDFTLALADRLRAWQPTLRTARNLYARPLLEPDAEQWFAQDYEQSLAAYDYTAIMAMPYMEQVSDPQRWLGALARRVAATPLGLERTVFELQARDWRTGKPVPDAELLKQWALLRRHGVRHLAYYPDDFHAGQPSLATARATVSVRETLSGDNEGLDTPPVLEPGQ
jgi:biofilm PGA synthesis lipoprotein PgaB